MPLRQTGPLPGAPLDLLRFLASSITFMASLKDVELYLDGVRLGHITKDVGNPQPVGVPPSLVAGQQLAASSNYGSSFMGNAGAMIGGWGDWGMRTPTSNTRQQQEKEVKWSWLSPRKYFTVVNVTSTPVHIRAEVIRWVYLAGSEKAKPLKKIPPPPGGSGSNNASGGGQTNSFLASLISSFGSSSRNNSSTSRPALFNSNSGRSTPLSHRPVPSLPSTEKVDVKKVAADQRKVVESSVLLSVFTAEANVKLDQKMEVELERATKKRAPPSVKVGLIYVSYIQLLFMYLYTDLSFRLARTSTMLVRRKIWTGLMEPRMLAASSSA
jgi:hypothetical protein